MQSKEHEIFQKQQRSQTSSIQISQSDFVDEVFYHEIEKRAKKAEQERREVARRARDFFHRQSSQTNTCFDTDDQITFALQPIPLNSSNRSVPIEKKTEFDFEENDTPAFPVLPSDKSENLEVEQEPQSLTIAVANQQR